MTTFHDISNDFDTFSKSITASVNFALSVESSNLLNDFQARSPVDTGYFRDNWQIVKPRFGVRLLGSIRIQNKTPYGQYMEYGAGIGKAPWHFTTKSKSKKLRIANNRVWAGGVRPGHSSTVNGAIGPVLFDNPKRLDALANKLADQIIGSF